MLHVPIARSSCCSSTALFPLLSVSRHPSPYTTNYVITQYPPLPSPLCFSENCSNHFPSAPQVPIVSPSTIQYHLPLELFSSTCWARVRHDPSPSANLCFAMMLRCPQDPASSPLVKLSSLYMFDCCSVVTLSWLLPNIYHYSRIPPPPMYYQ